MRRPKVVLDTDVASRLWRGTLDSYTHEKLERTTAVLTYVTIAEWGKWAYSKDWGERRKSDLGAFGEKFQRLWCDALVVSEWGRLSGLALRRGRQLSHNDCWIAACCVVNDHPLVTLNLKDFQPLEPLGLTLL